MGKTSHQNIEKLIAEIAAKIAQLKDGNLPMNEVENLVNLSVDLHERLAVLRHLAYQKYGEPETEKSSQIKQTDQAQQVETSFDFSAMTESAKEEIIETKKPEPTPTFDFSFTADLAAKTEKKTEPVIAVEETQKPIHVIREEIKQESSLNEKFQADQDVPLNEKLKQAEELPLRKKLGLQPISDLRTEIGIGKKFEYINFLFAGDAKAYETAITELNNCANADVAKQKLNVYASVYRWDLEDKTIIKFVELVERRFL